MLPEGGTTMAVLKKLTPGSPSRFNTSVQEQTIPSRWDSARTTVDDSLGAEDAAQIRAIPHLRVVQTSGPLGLPTLRLINEEILAHRPDVSFRAFGFYGLKTPSLDFLKELIEIRKLVVDCVDSVRDVSVLTELPCLQRLTLITNPDDTAILEQLPESMTALSIGFANRKALDLRVLRRFSRLSALSLVHHKKHIDALAGMPDLRSLCLYGLTLEDTDFFANIPRLEALQLFRSGAGSFSGLAGHPGLHWLKVFHVTKLDAVDFTAAMPALEYLELGQLRHVTRLPDYSRATRLARVVLDDLSGLRDVSGLGSAPALRECAVCGRTGLETEAVVPLLENAAMRAMAFRSSARGTNAAVEERIAQNGLSLLEPPFMLAMPAEK